MKVNFKTVQGTSFDLQLDAGSKVGDVKQRIEEKQGSSFAAANQVIIFHGRVLKDDTTLADAKVTEDGFIVVMISKPKAKPPAPAPAPAPATSATAAPAAAAAPASEAAPVAPALAAPEAAPAAPAAQPAEAAAGEAPSSGGADAYSSTASQLATGPALEANIAQICEMGFPRDQVLRAMRAAYNNPDRAVEYLMTGIPTSAEPPPPVAPAPQAVPGAAGGGSSPAPGSAAPPAAAGPNAQPLDMFAPQAPGPQGGAGAGGGGGAGGPDGAQPGALHFLRQNGQFQALRQIVQSNPAILQPMLQELGKQNPALLQLINNNQAEFLQLINEPAPAGQPDIADLAAQLGSSVGGLGAEGAGGGRTVEIQLTQEEQAAIQRLEGMGFDRMLCLEAFLACDKNEDLAANYLLENAHEDM